MKAPRLLYMNQQLTSAMGFVVGACFALDLLRAAAQLLCISQARQTGHFQVFTLDKWFGVPVVCNSFLKSSIRSACIYFVPRTHAMFTRAWRVMAFAGTLVGLTPLWNANAPVALAAVMLFAAAIDLPSARSDL